MPPVRLWAVLGVSGRRLRNLAAGVAKFPPVGYIRSERRRKGPRAMGRGRDDLDNPWKEILEQYFGAFIAFFFPQAHGEIDWGRGVEFLDKELQHAVSATGGGSRAVDKLAKVWLRTGEEAWLLVHVEVQSQKDEGFDERMYMYNSLLYCRRKRCVVSLGILGDTQKDWRPGRFEHGRWGCRAGIEFPVVKLLDYENRWEELERSSNPFAVVVMAHLKTQATRRDPDSRFQWKARILRYLYQEGRSKEEFADLFRFIDIMMRLPPNLEEACHEEIQRYEEERKMPLVSPFEKRAMAKGRQQGLLQGAVQTAREAVEEAMKLRFRDAPASLIEWVKQIDDPAVLKNLLRKAITAASLAEFEEELAESSKSK